VTNSFVAAFNAVADDVYNTALEKGWYDGGNRNLGEAVALMHSELSEALEALRAGEATPSDKLPDFLGVEEELADCIVRIMDISRAQKWRVAEALVAKIAYNKGRPPKHGKKF
jgi:NTP pyrophosphatase (non-canonical NTP hydrolase)